MSNLRVVNMRKEYARVLSSFVYLKLFYSFNNNKKIFIDRQAAEAQEWDAWVSQFFFHLPGF